LKAGIEAISDGDAISRLIDAPRMYDEYRGLIWEDVFQFPGRPCESVIWRRYAPEPGDVHRIGRGREAVARQRRPGVRYAGFISALAGSVRLVKTARGHGFSVIHAPEEGRRDHAHICYAPAEDGDASKLRKTDKSELKLCLRMVFDAEISSAVGE
jgi:hypothetical protein